MKEIRKYHVLLFIAGVGLLLGLVSAFVPKDGLKIGGVKFNFLASEYLIYPKTQEVKDISKIVAQVDTALLEIEEPLTTYGDSSKGNLGAPAKINYQINNATVVNLNDAAKQSLHKFFQKLTNIAESKKKIRILHYGDSQIEGDRMTAFIRQRIQEQFGGNGPGLIPAMNVYATVSYAQDYSENFVRYTCFGGPKLTNRKYGLLNSAARFTPEKLDSTVVEPTEAWIEVLPSKGAYGRARTYNNVLMFYNSCVEPCTVSVFQNGTLIHEEALLTDGKQHTLKLSFPSNAGNLKYVFKSRLSPNITGFSLEGDFGVQVDNVAMRGSSGTFFGAIDQALFAAQLNELNTEMVIFQFGGNSMPAFKDSSGVRNYARYVKGQLLTLKRLKPDLAIVMIGPSDMSTLIDGFYETYPLLPYCVSQMKKAVMDAGVGYWDLFEAMGGKNSMPAWVEKGLAGSDYIHFSIKGASIASQLFYDAFMAEYIKYSGN
jgi:lysophospholipase L1-like esterase